MELLSENNALAQGLLLESEKGSKCERFFFLSFLFLEAVPAITLHSFSMV